MKNKIRVLDAFSGIGGFSLAFKNAGFNVIGAIENDKNACQIYNHNFSDLEIFCSDVDKLHINELPEFDILISRVPLQTFSYARKEYKEEKDFSKLMYVKQIINEKRPCVFVFEAPTRIIRDEEQDMEVYREMGYNLQFFIADSEKITGLPLVEKRGYVVGYRNDVSIDSIILKENQKLRRLSDLLEKSDECNSKFYVGNMSRNINIINPLDDKVNCNFVNIPCINTEYGIRRISCREYARLKGFPDSFSIEMKNKWKLYRMILQSTNVAVAGEIARNIFEALNNMGDTETKQIIVEENSEGENKKNLTNSLIDRQNILNNELALNEIRKTSNIQGIVFEEKIYFTKAMAASFFDVDIRTIERYVALNEEELKSNGYELLKGKRLKLFKECLNSSDIMGLDLGSMSPKITQLAIFDFKSFLNMGMLLVESENARLLRQTMLSIVIDFINKKTGGSTTYVNQRDRAFLSAYLQEDDYRREFTDALKDCVDMDQFKYALFTDMIYQSIFKENAKEYREILKLKKKDRTRETFYSEVLDLIASYECGLAQNIRQHSESKGRKLSNWETREIFKEFEKLPHWKPLISSARTKMASRDLALRDAFHQQLEKYIKPLDRNEYNRFLGDESDQIARLMDENSDVLRRLKERE